VLKWERRALPAEMRILAEKRNHFDTWADHIDRPSRHAKLQ
jgi:hypothetical protein